MWIVMGLWDVLQLQSVDVVILLLSPSGDLGIGLV